MKILVAYATRHGATGGIAERLAARLRADGLEAEALPVSAEPDPSDYDASVIGSAAYVGRWLGEALTFVRRHQDAIAARPVWLFSSGPLGTETVDKHGTDVRQAAAPKEFVELRETIRPRDMRVFFGAFDPSSPSIGLAEKVVRFVPTSRSILPAGDFRDWPDIEGWADEIAAQLRGEILAREPAVVGTAEGGSR